MMSMLVLLAIQFLQLILTEFISFGSPYVSLAVLSMATGVLCCSVSCKILLTCATNKITRVANQPTVNMPGQVHPTRNRQSQQENNPVPTNEYQHDATELRARKKQIISMYKCTSISFIGSWCILSAIISICMLTLLEAVLPLLVYSDSLQFTKTFMPGDTNIFHLTVFFVEAIQLKVMEVLTCLSPYLCPMNCHLLALLTSSSMELTIYHQIGQLNIIFICVSNLLLV